MTIRDALMGTDACVEGRAWLAMQSIYVTSAELYDAVDRADWLAWSAAEMARVAYERATHEHDWELLGEILADLLGNARKAFAAMVRHEVALWRREATSLGGGARDYMVGQLDAIETGLDEDRHPPFPSGSFPFLCESFPEPLPPQAHDFERFVGACDEWLPFPGSETDGDSYRMLDSLAEYLHRGGCPGGGTHLEGLMPFTRAALPRERWCELAELFITLTTGEVDEVLP